MASREGEIAMWLHNKLGSTDDLWSGSSICSQLSRDKLLSIQDCFHNLQPYVKVKLMLSFLHLNKRNVEEWRPELEEILQMAQDDADQWVSVVGEILRTLPVTGALNMDLDDQHLFLHEVITELRKLVRKTHDVGMAPLECQYLSRVALQSVVGQQTQPVKHFALKMKPKSAALRAELLQKSSDAANHLKKSGGTSIPVKFRSFAKKMDDATPLRGIPSRTPPSGGFLKAGSLGSRFVSGTPSSHRTTPVRREGGIKLIDIEEQPLAAKEAKRRKKIAEQEAQDQQKKEKDALANTPDYAAGLMTPAVTELTNPAATPTTGAPSYLPSTANRLPNVTTNTLPQVGTVVSAATIQARENLQQQLQQQLGQSQIRTQPQPQQVIIQQAQQPLQAQQPQQPGIQQQPQPKKGLSLTREQMVEAQEMFRTSNKVTRPEKALILGFMAGSRENPCPQQGDIVNIRLSENMESIQQPDGTFGPMMVDTYLQMHYGTGEWKRIKKYREYEVE